MVGATDQWRAFGAIAGSELHRWSVWPTGERGRAPGERVTRVPEPRAAPGSTNRGACPPPSPLHSTGMEPRTLGIVLPAYNEADRLGPALDELFGYLRRRGERARDGAAGSAFLPPEIRVLVVDDGSTDTTAELVRARPEFSLSDGPVTDAGGT